MALTSGMQKWNSQSQLEQNYMYFMPFHGADWKGHSQEVSLIA